MSSAARSVRHVCVVVPAADEQDTIAGCLASIDAALGHARERRPWLTAQVVVVLDRCIDGTAAVVAAHPGVDAVSCTAGSVGAARDLGTRWAGARSPAPAVRTWTAHTDADSVVPTDWFDHQLDLADSGAAMVLGTVLPDLDTTTLSAWSERHHAGNGHPHVHGANLGIRADALLAIGGWGPHTLHEDADLVVRAEAAGLDIRRTGGAVVATSGRLTGRTPGGLAGYLRDLTGSGA